MIKKFNNRKIYSGTMAFLMVISSFKPNSTLATENVVSSVTNPDKKSAIANFKKKIALVAGTTLSVCGIYKLGIKIYNLIHKKHLEKEKRQHREDEERRRWEEENRRREEERRQREEENRRKEEERRQREEERRQREEENRRREEERRQREEEQKYKKWVNDPNTPANELAKKLKNSIFGLPNNIRWGGRIELKNVCFMNVGLQQIFMNENITTKIIEVGRTIESSFRNVSECKNDPIWNIYKIALNCLTDEYRQNYCNPSFTVLEVNIKLRKLVEKDANHSIDDGYVTAFFIDFVLESLKKHLPNFHCEREDGSYMKRAGWPTTNKNFISSDSIISLLTSDNVSETVFQIARFESMSNISLIYLPEAINFRGKNYTLSNIEMSIKTGHYSTNHRIFFKRINTPSGIQWYKISDRMIQNINFTDIRRLPEVSEVLLTYETET